MSAAMAPSMRRSSVGRVLVVAMLAVIGLLVPVAPAYAATIMPTSVTVAVDDNEVTANGNQTVNTTFAFCVPDGYAAGDSFTVTLPAVFSSWPASFPVNDGPVTVFNVTISTTSPAVATFVLTAAGAGTSNLCGRATFGANSGASAAGTYPLNYVIGGVTYTPTPSTLTVVNPTYVMPTSPVKGCLLYTSPSPRD